MLDITQAVVIGSFPTGFYTQQSREPKLITSRWMPPVFLFGEDTARFLVYTALKLTRENPTEIFVQLYTRPAPVWVPWVQGLRAGRFIL
jgi:hypothetical protein